MSLVERDEAAVERDVAAAGRDGRARSVDAAADNRDELGAERDTEAELREESASRRDDLARDRDLELSARMDAAADSSPDNVVAVAVVAEALANSVEDRASAEADRAASGLDRAGAEADRGRGGERRRQSAGDRQDSSQDRQGSSRDREEAWFDGLSGAYSREAGMVELVRDLARANDTDTPVVVVYLDIDGLHTGEVEGEFLPEDRNLATVVRSLRSHLRAHDVIARMGQDQLLCVLSGSDVADAVRVVAGVHSEVNSPTERWALRAGYAQAHGAEDAVGLVVRAKARTPPRGQHDPGDGDGHGSVDGPGSSAGAQPEGVTLPQEEFLSRLSHELRTPLNAVIGFAQVLDLDNLTPSQHQAIAHILDGGRHLLGMVDDILGINGSTGTTAAPPELGRVSVSEVVRDSVELTRSIAVKHQVQVGVDEPEQPDGPDGAGHLVVRADRRSLTHVLVNLVSNAITYNHVDGRVDIRVSTHGEGQLTISVVDTGIGIPAEALPRLFTPFDRLGRQALGVEGTGLGLVIARQLTTQMGGQLALFTSEGHGSTVTVTFPVG